MNANQENAKPLLTEFDAPSPEAWREAAEKLLKGAPFEKLMTRMTPEGIRLEPIFWKEVLDALPATHGYPGFDDFLRGTKAAGYHATPWEIAQELPYGLPAEFNQVAHADLMRGQTALNVILDIATLKGSDPDGAAVGEVGACGLSLACLEDFRTAFKGIVPEAVGFHLRSGCAGLAVGAGFFAWLDEVGAELAEVSGSLGMDPLAVWAAAGVIPTRLSHLLDEQAALAAHCHKEAPGIRAVAVSTLPYHQNGASAVQDLGLALASGAFYMQALTERGLSADEAASQIRFSFAVGGNFFMELAKLRAARILWAKVAKAFGASPEASKIRMHARTGLYNKTRKDPYVNLLRTTTEALSAVIAGVDSLCVGNFDEVSRMPDTFSRRISRNTQIILQEECELTAVADPAGGSWAVEWLTDQLARKAWSFFQEIEADGGIDKALEKGTVAEALGKTAAERETHLNQRRSNLIGTNVYPNLEEKSLEAATPDYAAIREARAHDIARARVEMDEASDARVMEALGKLLDSNAGTVLPAAIDAVEAGATLGEITRTVRSESEPEAAVRPIRARRLADHYEALRDAADAFAADTGRRPAIFLCNLGPLRRHKARADFTRGFFQAGGFEIVSPQGFEKPEDAVDALDASAAAIAVVCGTDDDYAAHFEAYGKAIKERLPETRLVLAGHPGDNEARFRAVGMDDYIFVKSDNYETNRRYLAGLGAL